MRTDVFEWQLPTGTSYEQAVAFAAALREALAERLGAESREIGIAAGRLSHAYAALANQPNRLDLERANATMKNCYGLARVCYRGLARNNCHLQFVACAMNINLLQAHSQTSESQRRDGLNRPGGAIARHPSADQA